jgi:ribulose-phosphate 3-epimerase
MVTIVPTILAKDPTVFEEDLKKVWKLVPRVQFDIIDGKFAPTETVMPEVLKNIDTVVEFDAHLMVDEPGEWIDRCVESGITGVYGQVEKMTDIPTFVADAQMAGLRVGLAYDLDTPIEGLEQYIDNIDGVLLLSVKAGAQGQKFDESVLTKIKEVRKMSKSVKIIVDGGLNVENIKKCFEAEWSEELSEDELDKSFLKMEFAVGSDLYSSADIHDELMNLEHLVH